MLYPAPETTAIAPFEVDSNNDSFWLSVLFSRGLSHGNPIIRDLVLPSLLSSSPFVIQLESSFLFGDLLQVHNICACNNTTKYLFYYLLDFQRDITGVT